MHTPAHELVFFFFFQAEDGIRDVAVTGVQTCALPISSFFMRPIQARGISLPSNRSSTCSTCFLIRVGRAYMWDIPKVTPRLTSSRVTNEIGRASCRERV